MSLEKKPRKLLNMRRILSLKGVRNALTVSTAIGRFNRRDEYGNL